MISIIIPTKNESRILATTLEKISKYSGDKEIIISDGGSSDGTIDIAKKYTEKLLVHSGKKRQNISQGRNTGAASAKGDYLVFMDADTSISDLDAFFSKALLMFKKNPKLGALTATIKVLPGLETFGDKLVFGFMNLLHRFYNNICRIGASTGEFQMMRKEVFNDTGGFNETFTAGEDYDLFRRISKKYKTVMEPSLIVYHTGRRGHTIGWPRLLSQWFMNYFLTTFLKRSVDKWDEIR